MESGYPSCLSPAQDRRPLSSGESLTNHEPPNDSTGPDACGAQHMNVSYWCPKDWTSNLLLPSADQKVLPSLRRIYESCSDFPWIFPRPHTSPSFSQRHLLQPHKVSESVWGPVVYFLVFFGLVHMVSWIRWCQVHWCFASKLFGDHFRMEIKKMNGTVWSEPSMSISLTTKMSG